MNIDCKHWSAYGHKSGGKCALNLHGGRPSKGVCGRCDQREALTQITVKRQAPQCAKSYMVSIVSDGLRLDNVATSRRVRDRWRGDKSELMRQRDGSWTLTAYPVAGHRPVEFIAAKQLCPPTEPKDWTQADDHEGGEFVVAISPMPESFIADKFIATPNRKCGKCGR